MENKIELKDPRTVLHCAFRYALGRKTYIVSSIVDEILNVWDELSIHTKNQMKNEILEHERLWNSLGDECDKEQWYKILNKEV